MVDEYFCLQKDMQPQVFLGHIDIEKVQISNAASVIVGDACHDEVIFITYFHYLIMTHSHLIDITGITDKLNMIIKITFIFNLQTIAV